MKKLKGPELKLSDLRMPVFLTDLYYDLRDRRLLPLVALGIVAVIAVPFLLSSGSKPEPVLPSAAGAAASSAANASELTVVRATPGLRDYRRRLKGRVAKDPFKQKFTAPDLSGAQLGSGAEEGGSTVSSSTSTSETTTRTSSGSTTVTKTTKSANGKTTSTTETESAQPQESGGSGGAEPQQITLYSFAADVKITRTTDLEAAGQEAGAASAGHETKSWTRDKVVPPAALPGEKTQVVTYIGISPKTHNPLLLVSDAVTAVFGEAKCLSGESKCQLLEVETGMPTTFVYGPDFVRYKINVLKVEAVTNGHF